MYDPFKSGTSIIQFKRNAMHACMLYNLLGTCLQTCFPFFTFLSFLAFLYLIFFTFFLYLLKTFKSLSLEIFMLMLMLQLSESHHEIINAGITLKLLKQTWWKKLIVILTSFLWLSWYWNIVRNIFWLL